MIHGGRLNFESANILRRGGLLCLVGCWELRALLVYRVRFGKDRPYAKGKLYVSKVVGGVLSLSSLGCTSSFRVGDMSRPSKFPVSDLASWIYSEV